jgi:integrase
VARIKLTDGLVAAAEPQEREAFLWDDALPRFGVRISPQGGRFYLVQYRAKGPAGTGSKVRRLYIGRHGACPEGGGPWNVTRARAEANRILSKVDLAHDPYAEREAEREAVHQAQLDAQEAEAAKARDTERRLKESVEAQVDLYAERRLAKRRSGAEAARLLRHGPVKVWAKRHVSEVRRADLVELLEDIRHRSPAVARATYAELRPFFEWCADRELIAVSPCVSVKAPPRPEARDRVLADAELRLIWRAADGLGFPFGHVFKLLMLTGQRRAEVAGMKWAEVDIDAGLWRIPAERAKNKQAHELDLSPEALAIIREVKALKLKGPNLFPARGGGAVRGFSATKRKLDAEVETLRIKDAEEAGELPPKELLPPWRIHDLRRTAATGMAAMAFPPHVVERVLNHVSGTQSGLVGVYQRHNYRAERKAALTAWGARVKAVLAGAPVPSNVIDLAAQRE